MMAIKHIGPDVFTQTHTPKYKQQQNEHEQKKNDVKQTKSLTYEAAIVLCAHLLHAKRSICVKKNNQDKERVKKRLHRTHTHTHDSHMKTYQIDKKGEKSHFRNIYLLHSNAQITESNAHAHHRSETVHGKFSQRERTLARSEIYLRILLARSNSCIVVAAAAAAAAAVVFFLLHLLRSIHFISFGWSVVWNV